MESKVTPPFLARLGALQTRYPWRFVVAALLTLVPAVWATLGLGFRADFAELLPDNKESVIEMRRVAKHLRGTASVIIVADVEGTGHYRELQEFVDALTPRLAAIGPAWVGAIDYGRQDALEFFDRHKVLYAQLADVKKAHDEVVERYDYEIAKRAGNLLDDDDPPPPISAASIKKRLLGDKPGAVDPADDPTHGYYFDKTGRYAAVVVRSSVTGKQAVGELRRRIEAAVAETGPSHFESTMRVAYTGDLVTSTEEYDQLVRDLGHVGTWGVIGVLTAVVLFFLRVRTILTMGASLLVGVMWAFGLTRYTIGYLNSSSGFLVSIIVGNGINYGIMYMARYIEARRDEGLGLAEAVEVAHRDSWVPTLASATTAMLAYGSLVVTDFRGFKHFGIIGGYGMLFCWVATYLFMPAFLVASERVWPAFRPPAEGRRPSRVRGYYGHGFARLIARVPRVITVTGAVVGVVAFVLAARFLLGDPMEYNLANVRSEPPHERRDRPPTDVDEIIGRTSTDGMAVLTDRLDQVPMLTAELQKRYERAPENLKPFDKVVTIFSLLPADQDAKLPLVNEMRDRILRAHARGAISDADWRDLQPYLPDAPERALGVDDLPEQAARPFTEVDGTRGRIVYIVPTVGQSISDAHYLIRWADSFRSTTLPTGEVIKGSGRAVIFADMIKTIVEDAPKAVIVASLGSIAVILVAFRNHRHAWGVFLPWLLGISGMLAFLGLADIKFNFLNFVAVPITIGVGAEYAHNLMQRYRIEGDARIAHVVVETGGAVVLCSLTTTIGYLALLLSINRGIVRFGAAAAAGEVTCVLAAVLVLPAALQWGAMRRRAARAALAASVEGAAGQPSAGS